MSLRGQIVRLRQQIGQWLARWNFSRLRGKGRQWSSAVKKKQKHRKWRVLSTEGGLLFFLRWEIFQHCCKDDKNGQVASSEGCWGEKGGLQV